MYAPFLLRDLGQEGLYSHPCLPLHLHCRAETSTPGLAAGW